MKKTTLRIFELVSTLIVSLLTVIIQPTIPLLAIPFLIILTMRSIFIRLEDTNQNEK